MSSAKTNPAKNVPDGNESALVPSPTPPSRRSSCAVCCRRILAFLASTVGLTVLAVAYSALGGYIFMVLESPPQPPPPPLLSTAPEGNIRATETGMVKDPRGPSPPPPTPLRPLLSLDGEAVRAARARHLELLWNTTERLNVIYRESWTEMAEEVLRRYAADVFEAVRVNETTAQSTVPDETTTTRHEEPQTQAQVQENQWSYPGSLLYAITVVTTIGYGHITPKTQWGMVATMVYAVFGIPLTFLTIAHLGRIMATAFRFVYLNICCFVCRLSRGRRRSHRRRPNGQVRTREAAACTPGFVENGADGNRKRETEVDYDDDVDDDVDRKRIADVKVPISVTVVVLVGYIGLGSLLFSIWEGWSPVEASYFCFITLSTIGFGDFVPGMSLDAERPHEKLLCCALYLLLGLSFLAMCFDLIQEEVVNKFRRLGRFVGLVKDSK